LLREKQGISEEESGRMIDRWISEADSKSWIAPKGRTGLFKCNSDGNTLIIYDPENSDTEIARLDFEEIRSNGKEQPESLAQYFLPKNSGKKDIVGFQIATAGTESERSVTGFNDADDAESAHLLYGLANRVAEDFAGMLHTELKDKTGACGKAGRRYSPGYPGLTIENNDVIHTLLNAGDLGIRLTEASGFLPMSTTAAIVCFHPDAVYV